MGLIACGHVFLFSSCYVIRCGFSCSKHEIFLVFVQFWSQKMGCQYGEIFVMWYYNIVCTQNTVRRTEYCSPGLRMKVAVM